MVLIFEEQRSSDWIYVCDSGRRVSGILIVFRPAFLFMINFFSDFFGYNTDMDNNQKNNDVLDVFVEKHIVGNKVVQTLKRRAILRKFLTFLVLISVWLFLLVNAYLSPQRVAYTEAQLATTRDFENESGRIMLTKQIYSEKNGILLLEFETSDYTSSIAKGISAKNLEWILFAKNQSPDTKMEVIPLANHKIDVIVKGVPKNFEAIAINITNKTVVNDDVDVGIEEYNDVTSSESEYATKEKKKKDVSELSNEVQFMVAEQGEKIKRTYLQNLSRETFALNAFEEEKNFQNKQIEKLQKAIERLEGSIAENKSTLADLERSGQYLVGSNLIENQEKIENVEQEISGKQIKINQAKDNIVTLQNAVEALEHSMQEVHDGTYQFNAPITSVEMDF
ncbi:hypothetical protein STRDD11_01662 [Streptococcus sp. DD11]|nr:hypothetical protein STRDD11_01662 [Streptococcus sp. DD11]